jgi:serine/threonine protein kinase/WD40 repeat protein
MPLAPGARLGPYEVIAPLGAGGMGEVYRARDERLGRELAIKVLPAGLASDPERLRRFEREARSASSLNHPNIVTIYDIGSVDSTSYIAMELVKGEPLRTVLLGGALPVRRLLQIGTQVAEGLARAHAAGIVHRDLKPENVMVTEDGLVKILDFGLAKLTQPEAALPAETMVPTVSGATQEGIIVGTVGYMSPEQAVGGAIDFRSDQFSFGSILYEMATGRRAFRGDSAPQTLAAIIQDEPQSIGLLNPKVPVPVRWIVERCLAKRPRDRYASTEDLARDLATVRDRLSETTSASGVRPPEPAPGARRAWRIGAAVAAGILLALALAGWQLQRRDYFWKNPLADARFTRFTDWEGSESDASISRDGKFVAFISDRSGRPDVWLGQVGGGTFLNLSKGQFVEFGRGFTRGTGFSGDGAHVWFQVQSRSSGPYQVWLVPTIGGASQLFLPRGVEATWSPDGNQIAYFFQAGDPVFVADKNAANAAKIVPEKKGFHNHYLAWSPDGRFIYFVRGAPPDDMDIWRVGPSGGEPERLTQHHGNVSYPTLLDASTLVYCATREDGGRGLFAMNVDRRIPHAITSGLEDFTSVSSSSDGRRLAVTVANPIRNLWAAPITDQVVEEPGISRFDLPTVRASAPRYGPDYVLYLSSKGGAPGLWKSKDGSETELWKGSDGAVPFAAGVSLDGTQIAFVTRGGGRHRLTLIASDGTNVRRIAESLDVVDVPSWSPDGKWLAVVGTDDEGKTRPVYKVPVEGGPPVRLVDGVNFDPVWSPDGRLILYSEGFGGAALLRGITPEKQPVSLPEIGVAAAGNRYRFLPGGRSVVFVPMRVGRENKSSDYFLLDLESGRVRQLTHLRPDFIMKSFDVSPDGKRILFDRYLENSDVVLVDLQR